MKEFKVTLNDDVIEELNKVHLETCNLFGVNTSEYSFEDMLSDLMEQSVFNTGAFEPRVIRPIADVPPITLTKEEIEETLNDKWESI